MEIDTSSDCDLWRILHTESSRTGSRAPGEINLHMNIMSKGLVRWLDMLNRNTYYAIRCPKAYIRTHIRYM